MNRPRWLVAVVVLLGMIAAVGIPAAERGAPHVVPQRPQRIMSVNMCTDLLLLMLVPRERIASISYLAHDAVTAIMPGADRGIETNRGVAEEIIRARPDLILASPWTSLTLRNLSTRIGIPVVTIDEANSFADIRRVTLQMGDVVGEPARARALVARMERTLAELAATRPAHPVRVVAWTVGSVPGRGTLTDSIIRAAGAENIAARYEDGRFSSYGLEELLASRPDAIMQGEARYGAASLQDAASIHPVLRAAFRGRQISYPASFYACGVPQSAEAARELRQALARIPEGPVAW